MVSFRKNRRTTPGSPPLPLTPGPPRVPPPFRNPLLSSNTPAALASWRFSCSSCQWRNSWAEKGMGACGHSLCPPLFIFPASQLFSLSFDASAQFHYQPYTNVLETSQWNGCGKSHILRRFREHVGTLQTPTRGMRGLWSSSCFSFLPSFPPSLLSSSFLLSILPSSLLLLFFFPLHLN